MQKAISLYPMNEQGTQYAIAPKWRTPWPLSREGFLDQIAAGSGPNFTVDPQEKPNQKQDPKVLRLCQYLGVIAQRPNLPDEDLRRRFDGELEP